jgi:hypothetical protein
MLKTKKVKTKTEKQLQKNLKISHHHKFTNKITKKKTKKHTLQKTIRIITIDEANNDCKNDMNVYIDIFKKLGYNIDIHILDTNPKIHIKYAPNPYYNINLFIDRIGPLVFNIKTIFPSRINIFAPNVNTFQNYKEIRDIDIVLCNTKQCYNFINFIRKENSKKYNYKFKSYYTNFTTHIPIQLSQISNSKHNTNMSNTKSMSFIHTANNQKFKNTGSLIHCWLKYNSNTLNCELHVLCHGLCMTTLLLDIKKMYHYDLLNTYNFEKVQDKHSSNTILKYKNLYLYLDLKPHDIKYKELIKNADVALCPSRKENYPHYINTARYFNLFVITMNHPPMNELITKKYNDNDNVNRTGYLLQKSKVNKKLYKETNYRFDENYINNEELRDSIIWCLEHKSDIRKYNNTNNGRKMFLDDKKYFENSIEKIIKQL